MKPTFQISERITYLGGAPTTGGSLEYYYDKDHNGIWEIGYPDTYGNEVAQYRENLMSVDELEPRDWLLKKLKELKIL